MLIRVPVENEKNTATFILKYVINEYDLLFSLVYLLCTHSVVHYVFNYIPEYEIKLLVSLTM